jgi:hypothetical protein
VGGLAAGLLLGPAIAGRVLPQTWERVYVGGVPEREQRDTIDRDYQGRAIFLEQRLDAEGLASLREEHQAERMPAVTAWRDAVSAHQQPRQIAVAVAVGLMLLLVGAGGVSGRDGPTSWIAALSVGGWSAVVPGVAAFAVLRHLLDVDLAAAAAVAACVAIGPFVLTVIDRRSADLAEIGGHRLVRDAGRVASVLAIGVAAWAAWRHDGLETLAWVTPLAALPVGWALRLDRHPVAMAVRDRVLVPTVAASVALGVDLYDDFWFWPLLLLIIASADGRWIGATTGAMLLGQRQWLRTMRLMMGTMASGPTQIAVAAVVVQAGLIDGSLALAVAVGAITVEVSPPLRRAMSRHLSDMEDELRA